MDDLRRQVQQLQQQFEHLQPREQEGGDNVSEQEDSGVGAENINPFHDSNQEVSESSSPCSQHRGRQ